ncbi:hypothetical protein N0V83_003426 [Neocucurbitaria cava]|uniref:Cytochrome P450 n=1 Tax=Neocucurbitaria cava TaxID=798079 RepID=A0A9W8YEI1_9PLEO|nr:hypothetical protein N0V83_003426 [Neocucurbitaria cava]
MVASTLHRLLNADVPWLHHVLILTSALVLPSSGIRTFLSVHCVIAILFDTEALLAAFQNPNEPPLIPHPYLPFLGHVVGMFWYGAKYFALVNTSTQHPIFSLQTLTTRTVVVIDPALATAIQKKSPHLTFYGLILRVTRRLVDLDNPTMKIISWNLDGVEHGPHEKGLLKESEDMIHGSLSPGPILNSLSTTQLEQFSTLLNDFVPRIGDGQSVGIGLMEFIKQIFTVANAYTIYGPSNPFALHPRLVQSFWDYEAGMVGLIPNILPSITSRKSWKARTALNAAFHEFVENGHFRQASSIIQKRAAFNMKHGLTADMSGRTEVILLFGILGNAVPTTFWFLAHILSRPELLDAIRQETSRAIINHQHTTNEKENARSISVSLLKSQCPLFVSTYRESLRHIANLSSVRMVTGTHTVSAPGHPSYLLNKGNIIQMASGVIHAAPRTWGSDAAEFRPERWMTSTPTSSDDKKRTALLLPKSVPSAAFRPFGGGAVLCPGRHFAMTEILSFVALCVNMFDFTEDAVQGGGAIKLPEKDDSRMPLSVMKPVKEPIVRVRRRAGTEGVKWRVEWRVEL